MGFFSLLCLLIALGLGLRVAMIYANAQGLRDERRGEYERHHKVVSLDPTNAGSYARLAEMLYEDGQIEDAIASWRRAVYLMPQGPFTNKWKRDLKRALEHQGLLERGERPLEQHEIRICSRCECQVPLSVTTCPNCGETLHLSFANTLAQNEVAKSWARETLVVSAVLFVFGIVLASLPLEAKGAIIISASIVGFFVWRRAMDG